jgi:anthranilate synthase/aminodeoxychorismate synthase-like glutamine amidotransferase
VDYFNQIGAHCEVIRNDVTPHKINIDKYKALVLSPGPGKPEEAGFLMEYIRVFQYEMPILGICLGHQAIAKFYGAEITKAQKPMHGKISKVKLLNQDEIVKEIPIEFEVVRYHSLIAKNFVNTLLQPLAETHQNENMIFKHQFYPIYGIQYHPEAALTDYGLEILSNWNELVDKRKEAIFNKL